MPELASKLWLWGLSFLGLGLQPRGKKWSSGYISYTTPQRAVGVRKGSYVFLETPLSEKPPRGCLHLCSEDPILNNGIRLP